MRKHCVYAVSEINTIISHTQMSYFHIYFHFYYEFKIPLKILSSQVSVYFWCSGC